MIRIPNKFQVKVAPVVQLCNVVFSNRVWVLHAGSHENLGRTVLSEEAVPREEVRCVKLVTALLCPL